MGQYSGDAGFGTVIIAHDPVRAVGDVLGAVIADVDDAWHSDPAGEVPNTAP